MRHVTGLKSNAMYKKLLFEVRRTHERYGVMLNIGIQTGLRISDILGLRVGDILGQEEILVIEKKTKKERLVKIPPCLYFDVERLKKREGLEAGDYIVYSSRTRLKAPVSRIQAYRVLKQAAKRAGLKINVGTHTMRKTYAREHYKANKDIYLLQRELNHKFVSTTLCYLLDKESLNELDI